MRLSDQVTRPILSSDRNRYPKLRNIELFPFEQGGEQLVGLRDPAGIADNQLFLRVTAVSLLSLLDGRHSVEDIQTICCRHYGQTIVREQIDALVERLDESLFLDSPNFERVRRAIAEDFRRSSVREAAHAGKAYHSNQGELSRQLDGYFVAADGPGFLPSFAGHNPVLGLIAPHIDFHRGGTCYAWAYSELAAAPEADVYLILGIGHAGLRQFYTLTEKDFQTPFGTLKTDHDFVGRIRALCPFDLFEDEPIHRREHSVEFQVVFLQHILKNRPDAQIVPVLCGSFHSLIQSGLSPKEHPAVLGFISAVRQAIASCGKRVCVIAGVDLAHVGKRFGDQEPLTSGFLDEVREVDGRLLHHVERLDAESLIQDIRRDQDRRRICGYPAIYTLLSVVDAHEGRLLRYEQAADVESQQAVTFASMVLR